MAIIAHMFPGEKELLIKLDSHDYFSLFNFTVQTFQEKIFTESIKNMPVDQTNSTYIELWKHRKPRVLIIDMTRIGGDSATGQLKASLFAGWPNDRLMQVYNKGTGVFGIYKANNQGVGDVQTTDMAAVLTECETFRPEVIYYRPVELYLHLHEFAIKIINRLRVPLVTHIMDDWPERLYHKKPKLYARLDSSLRELLKNSQNCLSICDAMSNAYKERYSVNFISIANCIQPDEWLALDELRRRRVNVEEPVIIRYAGGLAEDMNFQSVLDVARAVDALKEQIDIRFEIYTMPRWMSKAEKHLRNLKGVSIYDNFHPWEQYQELLVGCDALLIAYNFDKESIRYVRYSMANKLPECMASAVPVLVYGPLEVATVAYAAQLESFQLVTERDKEKLCSALRHIALDPEYFKTLGEKARLLAFERHNCMKVRNDFQQIILQAAQNQDGANTLKSAVECDYVKVDSPTGFNYRKNNNTNNSKAGVKKPVKNLLMNKQTFYNRVTSYLIGNHRALARIGKFIKWSLRTLKQKFLGIGGLGILSSAVLFVGAVINQDYRWLFAIGGVGVLLAIMSVMLLSYAELMFYRHAAFQRREANAFASHIRSNLDKKISDLSVKTSKAVAQADKLFDERIAEVKSVADILRDELKSLDDRIHNAILQVDKNKEKINNNRFAINNTAEELSKIEEQIASGIINESDDKLDKEVTGLCEVMEGLKEQFARLEQSMGQISENQHSVVSEVRSISETLPDKIKKETQSFKEFTSKLNTANASIFQRFNRQLRREDISRIEKDWLPRLGLKLDSSALGYLAHRICLAEDTCVGRLATSIEAALLRVLMARSIQDRKLNVLEIGTLFGVGVIAIHECCRGIFEKFNITVIDPLDGYYGKNNLDILTQMPVSPDTLNNNMKRMNIPEDQFTVIPELSTQDYAIKQAAKRRYDMLIIDGDHSLFGVKHDFYNYKNLVKHGGYIIFDDYNSPEWPDIKIFVDGEVMGLPELEFIGAEWRTAVFRVIAAPGTI